MWKARLGVFLALCVFAAPVSATENPFARIGHIVIIYTENRSFDHLFGFFPGAEGLNSTAAKAPQRDHDGNAAPFLTFPFKDARFPSQIANAPFALDPLLGEAAEPVDPVHNFYQEQEQIAGGRMDHFVEVSNVGALTMGYRDGRTFRQWRLAQEFTLADHFFHGAFGGSSLNHFFLVCACAPTYADAPQEMRAAIDESGRLLRKETARSGGDPDFVRVGKVTPDGYAFGKFLPFAPVGPPETQPQGERLPMQNAPTIADRLDEKGVSWAWYAGGWDDVATGRAPPYAAPDYFQVHHQPFLYFAGYGPGDKGRAHLRDLADLLKDAAAGTLPQVAFYKPVGRFTGHPGYSSLHESDAHVGEIVDKLRASPNWRDMLIVVTTDENGGFWDHVGPPKVDRFGPGARVPTLIVSPFARRGFVDTTIYDTTSILRTIEARFALAPLTARDAAANDLRNALTP